MSDKSFKFMTDFSIVSEYISESVTQKKQYRRTNNDIHNIHIKLKIE
jgi:hypothetical protein